VTDGRARAGGGRRPERRSALARRDDPQVVLPDDDSRSGLVYRDVVELLRELWRTDRWRLGHHLLGAVVGVFMLVEISLLESDELGWLIALAAIGALALLALPRWPFAAPLVVLLVLAAMATVSSAAVEDTVSLFVVLLLATWCLGAYNDPRHALSGLIAAEALGAYVNTRFDGGAGDFFWVGVFIGVTWLAAFVVNRRMQQARALTERARLLEQEREQAAHAAVEAERVRISRELHDVIAHSVSVMTVQAGAVRRLLQPEQERERAALEAVEETGRQALTEMRRLIGMLRPEGEAAELAPQPGLRTLEALLGDVREAGLPVELDVEGEPRELAPGLDLSVYRLVQEVLTRALRAGGPVRAWVVLRWREDELELEVANDGAAGESDGADGHSLAGMRERIALYGGELETGPRRGGGFRVLARVPLAILSG
jgi:signal transduction histidine kinase